MHGNFHESDSNPGRSSASHAGLLRHHTRGFEEIRKAFDLNGDGSAALAARSALADELVAGAYREWVSRDLTGPEGFALVALAGYARKELFPFSDVDLLFLSANGSLEATRREVVAGMARTLWDLRLHLSHSSRTLAECSQLHRENLEFSISLLDARYVAGDISLFKRLRTEAIPRLVGRERNELVAGLAQMTESRRRKFGDTVFHLEPNVKETPGGLRDLHVARWLVRIADLEKTASWSDPEELFPRQLAGEVALAFDFLSAVRCFLHFQQGRDDNLLSYEFQDLAAERGIGLRTSGRVAPPEWTRSYFRHARTIDSLLRQVLEEIAPARSSLYSLFQDWRSRLSNADFSVVRGKIYPRQPHILDDVPLVFRLFEMMARHGLEPSRDAERWVEQCLACLPNRPLLMTGLWNEFRRVLVLPHAAAALRAMHRLGLLGGVFPEFHSVDCLVIRDYFHRYTVDEHSFQAIQILHAMRPAKKSAASVAGNDWEARLGEILAELEQPDLLFLALLFHDVGKGIPGENHVAGSLQAVEGVFERIGLAAEEREAVRFLISHHLEMSVTLQRRDIFDPETVRAFASRVGTPERLKMLCLLTYADIKAVTPEAMTPWKAEMLWRLYVSASNFLARSVDDERVHGVAGDLRQVEEVVRRLSARAPADELRYFLEGFPLRYVESHTPEEILEHFGMAHQLLREAVQVRLRPKERFFELTVLTADRPFLFASITGTLAAWGMNILKADAFANQRGIVLDTFRFEDLYRTLEMNPTEMERLIESIAGELAGKADPESLIQGRLSSEPARVKVRIPTQIRFDDEASPHSTLLELIAQDRPGLLYRMSSTLAELGCNIEVALIDTEGQKVIDVFYLTKGGRKLPADLQEKVREALQRQLGAPDSPPSLLPPGHPFETQPR